jgi:hypothetical protein
MTIDKPQKQTSRTGDPHRSKWIGGSGLFFHPLGPPLLSQYAQSFSFHGVVTFLPTYMSQNTSFQILSWDSVAIGGMLSGIALFMGVFGQFTGGVLAEKKNLKRNIALMGVLSFIRHGFMTDVPFYHGSVLLFLQFFPATDGEYPYARYTTLKMRATAFIFSFAAFGLGSMAASFSDSCSELRSAGPGGLSASNLILIVLSFMLIKVRNPLEAMGLAVSERV